MSTISRNRPRKVKEQLNNGKSDYGQWTWSLDTTWMDNELMMDWLMDDCFPLFYLLTYFTQCEFPENFRKFSRILFLRKGYNPNCDWNNCVCVLGFASASNVQLCRKFGNYCQHYWHSNGSDQRSSVQLYGKFGKYIQHYWQFSGIDKRS